MKALKFIAAIALAFVAIVMIAPEAAGMASAFVHNITAEDLTAGLFLAEAAAVPLSKELREKLDSIGKNLNTIMTEWEPEIKAGKEALKGVSELKEKVSKASEDIAGWTDEVKEMREEINKRQSEFEAKFSEFTGAKEGGPERQETPGVLLGNAVREMKKANQIGVTIQGKTRVKFKVWGFEGPEVRSKTIINTSVTGDPVLSPYYRPGIIRPGERPMVVRDLMPEGRTENLNIVFMRETSATDNAAPQTAQGAKKGESDFTFEQTSTEVKTIAHWVKVSTQMLDDVAQLESYVNSRMMYFLMNECQDQLLTGDGTGQNISGLVTNATAFDASLLTDLNVSNTTDIDRLRAAILQVQQAEYPPSGIVLSYLNWAALELTKDADNQYIFSRAQDMQAPRIWGLPVVATQAMPDGSYLVGAFALGAQVWNRMDAAVAISTEDDTNFQDNLATIRAEERVALTIYRTAAFVTGNLSAGSGS